MGGNLREEGGRLVSETKFYIKKIWRTDNVQKINNSNNATGHYKLNSTWKVHSHGSAVGYGLEDPGGGVRVRVPVGSRMFTSPYPPDRYRELFFRR